jgi:hypothetical protein
MRAEPRGAVVRARAAAGALRARAARLRSHGARRWASTLRHVDPRIARVERTIIMGTASKDQNQNDGNQMQQGMQGMQGSQSQGVGSPITNEAYNVVSALHSKLEGLEAYRKYAKDPNSQIWQNLTQIELKAVGTLVDELERLVKDGKFRMKEPGRAG